MIKWKEYFGGAPLVAFFHSYGEVSHVTKDSLQCCACVQNGLAAISPLTKSIFKIQSYYSGDCEHTCIRFPWYIQGSAQFFAKSSFEICSNSSYKPAVFKGNNICSMHSKKHILSWAWTSQACLAVICILYSYWKGVFFFLQCMYTFNQIVNFHSCIFVFSLRCTTSVWAFFFFYCSGSWAVPTTVPWNWYW